MFDNKLKKCHNFNCVLLLSPMGELALSNPTFRKNKRNDADQNVRGNWLATATTRGGNARQGNIPKGSAQMGQVLRGRRPVLSVRRWIVPDDNRKT